MVTDYQYLIFLREEVEERYLEDLKKEEKTGASYRYTRKIVWNEEEINNFGSKTGISRRTIIDYLKKEAQATFKFPNSVTFDIICQYLGFQNLKDWQNQRVVEILNKEIASFNTQQEEMEGLKEENEEMRSAQETLKEHLGEVETQRDQRQEEIQRIKAGAKHHKTLLKRMRAVLALSIIIWIGMGIGYGTYSLRKNKELRYKVLDAEAYSMEALKDSVESFINSGNLTEAILYYKKILKKYPNNAVIKERLNLLRYEKILQANRKDIFIATASPDGTFSQIGKNIQEVNRGNLPIRLLETEGSDRNSQLLMRGDIPLAIIQFNKFVDDRLARWIKSGRGKEIFPLYQEEIHVIIHQRNAKKIRNIQDLNNKKVVISYPRSGNYHTIQQFKHDVELEWKDYPMHFGKEGFDALKDGKVDAIAFAMGSPGNIIQYLDSTLLFISIENNILDNSSNYEAAFIPENIYKTALNGFHHQAVKTYRIAKPAYIVGANYEKGHPFYNAIYELVSSILNNQKKLKGKHPKWRDVFNERLFTKDKYFSELHPASREAIQDWLRKEN